MRRINKLAFQTWLRYELLYLTGERIYVAECSLRFTSNRTSEVWIRFAISRPRRVHISSAQKYSRVENVYTDVQGAP